MFNNLNTFSWPKAKESVGFFYRKLIVTHIFFSTFIFVVYAFFKQLTFLNDLHFSNTSLISILCFFLVTKKHHFIFFFSHNKENNYL